MWRGILLFAIFVVTFFVGMQIGTKTEKVDVLEEQSVEDAVTVKEIQQSQQNKLEEHDNDKQTDVIIIKPEKRQEQNPAETKEHYTKKAASLLEGIVNGICNFIVGIFYKLADLFF